MKRIFTLSLLMLCFAFTNVAQVQVGNSLMGAAAGDEFGHSVSISADGNKITATALNVDIGGLTYYDYSGSTWEQMTDAVPNSRGVIARLSEDGNSTAIYSDFPQLFSTVFNTNTQAWDFGGNLELPSSITSLDIAISGDGQRVISGNETETKIWEKDANGNWAQFGQTISQRADFVDISGDGNRIIISNNASGVLRTYQYNSATSMWEIQFTSGTDTGEDVAISSDGNFIGFVSTDFSHVGVIPFEEIIIIGDFIPIPSSGACIDLSASGKHLVIGDKGEDKATKLYEYNGTSWMQIGETIEFSGDEVAISADGTTIVIGDASINNNQGEVRVYDFSLVNVTNVTRTNIKVFPNPTFGDIQLQNVNADKVEIFDNTGRAVKTISSVGNSLDISELAAGFYFLKIYEGEAIYSAKVIKE